MLIVRRWGSRQAGHGSLCGVSDQQHEEYSGDHRSDQTSLPMPEQRVDSDYGSSSDEELPVDVDRIANIVVARIENKLEQHLHLPMEMPSVEQAEALREKAPELYHLWLRIAGQKADTESYVERAPYQVPERLARGGRPWALGALLIVLAFCGYVASLGGAGPYIGGIIAALDLIAMLGLFFGFRPEDASSLSKRRRNRSLSDEPSNPPLQVRGQRTDQPPDS